MEFEQAINIIQLAVIVVMAFMLRGVFPPQATKDLIEQIKDASAKTDTKYDDMLIGIVEQLNELRNSSTTSTAHTDGNTKTQ